MENYKKNSSFTLIELLVVIVIIGVLAGVITVSVSSFVTNSQNTKMVAQLSSLGTALETYGTYYQGNLCLEDSNNNSNFLSYTGIQTIPSHPSYDGLTAGNQTTTGTNNCLLYFSDGQNYSIRTPAAGNNGYLIQESRYMKTQDVQTSCESGWIPFGNRCIMKYEAKAKNNTTGVIDTCPSTGCSPSSYTAVSQADGIPWRYATQDEAKAACQAIGAHLITNAEWMALARDIESVSSNWVGSIGSGVLKRGNVGDTATGDYNGPDPDYGGNTNPSSNRTSSSPAKLVLSNGEEIWDLSGNMWEWVDATVPTQSGMTPNRTSFGWGEINAITNWGSTNLVYTEVGPKNIYTSPDTPANHGLGRIYYNSSDNTIRAFLRGGYWGNTSNAGVFALYLNHSPESRYTSIGFRCAR